MLAEYEKVVPYIGNFIGEGDDIGEALTDNADGNTEGMINLTK